MHTITVQTFGYDNETIGFRVALLANIKFATPVTLAFAQFVRAEGGIQVDGPDNDERDAICDKLTKVGVIAGALPAMRERMKDRAVRVYPDDDEASEVAEMLAAPAIRWG